MSSQIKPTPGSTYVVIPGDNLSTIAARAYGTPRKWRIIWAANKTRLKSDNPDLIFPGEVLVIPGDSEKEAIKTAVEPTDIVGKDLHDCTLMIGGTEIPIDAANIKRSIDTCVDGWTASTICSKFNPAISALLRPYQYKPAKIYLGNKLIIDGVLYAIENVCGVDGRTKNLEGFSKAADIVDSTIKPPFEFKKQTLQQIATSLLTPYGAVLKYQIDDVEPFDKVTAEPTDTVFSFLNGLCQQRGALLASDFQGSVVIWRAITSGTSVGTIKEGAPPYKEMSIRFDGRQRFATYQAIGTTPGRKQKSITATSVDPIVTRTRMMTFSCSETTATGIQKAADWRRSKQLAEALTMPFPVYSWYDPSGNLWKENTLVTVVSETLEVPNGFQFLIKAVEYHYDSSGTTATLDLVPPQVYSGEPIGEPWLM